MARAEQEPIVEPPSSSAPGQGAKHHEAERFSALECQKEASLVYSLESYNML